MTDAELDTALGALTAIDVDPRMQARVLRAIEAPAARVVARAFRPAWAGAASAALVVAAAVIWRLELPSTPPSAAAAPPPITNEALAVPTVPEDVRVPVVVREAGALRHTSLERPWPYSMPPLEREPPLDIDRIRHTPLAAPALGVEPLKIAGLEIESLDR